MATQGFVGQHFNCQMTIENEIGDVYTVKIKASPSLTIDKAAVVGTELTYTYLAGQGLISQNVGIVGSVVGRFKLFADITTPYFIDADGPVIKKDEIDIEIVAGIAEGWSGTYAGCAQPGTLGSITNDTQYVGGDLVFKRTVTVLTGITQVGKTTGWQSNLSVMCKIVKPNMAVVYDTYALMDQMGAYYFYPIEEFRIEKTNTPSGTIGNSTFLCTPQSDPPIAIVRKSSGLIYWGIRTLDQTPITDPFSNEEVGATIDYNANGVLSVFNPDITTSVSPTVTCSYVDGVRFSFSGFVPSYFTQNAIFYPIPTSCIRVDGKNVNTGGVSLQVV